jgi:hypothetical protein
MVACLPFSEGPEKQIFFDGTLASGQLRLSNTDEAQQELVLVGVRST